MGNHTFANPLPPTPHVNLVVQIEVCIVCTERLVCTWYAPYNTTLIAYIIILRTKRLKKVHDKIHLKLFPKIKWHAANLLYIHIYEIMPWIKYISNFIGLSYFITMLATGDSLSIWSPRFTSHRQPESDDEISCQIFTNDRRIDFKYTNGALPYRQSWYACIPLTFVCPSSPKRSRGTWLNWIWLNQKVTAALIILPLLAIAATSGAARAS